jgi:hypothetical protein
MKIERTDHSRMCDERAIFRVPQILIDQIKLWTSRLDREAILHIIVTMTLSQPRDGLMQADSCHLRLPVLIF